MPPMRMLHEVDPRQDLVKRLGPELNDVDVFNTNVLVAIYIRPSMTTKGIALPDQVRDEDEHQGKACLIVKAGPVAFKDPENKWFVGADVDVGDWIIIRPSDGWPISINGVKCRFINDTAVRAKIPAPDMVW